MQNTISKQARNEVLEAVRERYQQAPKQDKTKILDEFVAVAGCHRKHAIRLLSGNRDGIACRRHGGSADLRRGGTSKRLSCCGKPRTGSAESVSRQSCRGSWQPWRSMAIWPLTLRFVSGSSRSARRRSTGCWPRFGTARRDARSEEIDQAEQASADPDFCRLE